MPARGCGLWSALHGGKFRLPTWARSLPIFISVATTTTLLVVLMDCRRQAMQPLLAVDADPQDLAAEHGGEIVIQRLSIRWLWWPLILYFFWGMAYVCDEYFVRTIEVISERFQIPDDVAGATLMALGCNGPEMALNTIAIFQPSDIGVGAVVGGEVFNVLVITGAALLATPAEYMPLRIGKFSFCRDVVFYLVSLMMLYGILHDQQITSFEAGLLLCGAASYSLVVSTSNRMRRLLKRKWQALILWWRQVKLSDTGRKMSLGAMSFRDSSKSSMASADGESEYNPEEEAKRVAQWESAKRCVEPSKGTVFDVRVETHNRLLNRCARSEERYMWATKDALVVSTVPDPRQEQKQGRHTSGMVTYHFRGQKSRYLAGGLVNKATMVFDDEMLKASSDVESAENSSLYAPLLSLMQTPLASTITRGGPEDVLGVYSNPTEEIPFRDILYCDPVEKDKESFVLHVHRHEGLDESLGKMVTLVIKSNSEEVTAAWVNAVGSAITHTERGTGDHAPETTCASKVSEIVEWFQFPVKFLASVSIPDLDDPSMHKYYPLAFCTSMAWLAVFAYCVVSACEWIHEDFGISTAVLGFTVAAAGTSFPNVFSGMVVSRQGKTTMALANALGANIQNVFLALAVPWMIQSSTQGPITMEVPGLTSAIFECVITLLPSIFVFFLCGFTMPKWSGALYLLTYGVYLVIALMQESTGDEYWPLHK